jgi:hypothetical protein
MKRLWILVYYLNVWLLERLVPLQKVVLVNRDKRYSGAIDDWSIEGDEVIGTLKELDAQS